MQTLHSPKVLTELDDTIAVGLSARVREPLRQLCRILLVMVGSRDGTLNHTRRVLELEKHDARHGDISLVVEVEREEEGG